MAESTTDDSKALVRRFYAALDAGDPGAAMAMLAHDFRLNLAGRPSPLDAGGLAEFGGTLFRAFPDLHHTIVQQIAEGVRVLTHLTFAGTHRDEFQGVPSTGRQIDVAAMNVHRIVDGRIAEQWAVIDQLSLLRQLGVVSE